MCDSHQPLNGADSDPALHDCHGLLKCEVHNSPWIHSKPYCKAKAEKEDR